MSRPSSTVLAIAAAGVLAVVLGVFALRKSAPSQVSRPLSEESVADAPSATEPTEEAPVRGAATPSVSLPPTTAAATTTTLGSSKTAAAPLNEVELMATMREVRRANPQLSLELARKGNEQFKDSAGAAERGWTIVKSLTDLGRHEEALTEARLMFQKFKGTQWANDVHRHMLMNPPTHPLERGFGKELELDEAQDH